MARTVGTAVMEGAIQVVSEDTGKVTVFSQVSFHYILFCLILSLLLGKNVNDLSWLP